MKVDGRKLGHDKLEEIRIEAIRAVQTRTPPTQVAREMGLYTNRIFVWLALYRTGGWDALRAKKATGRPKRLSSPQLKWIYLAITTKHPMQLQFPFALWTRGMMRTLIDQKYGIKLSLASVGRLLAQMGLSCQKPLYRAFEQNKALVQDWIEREFPKIQRLAKKEKAIIFFSDESWVRSDFHTGTTWVERGKTPVIRHTGKRFHLNMLSAISAKGELRFMTNRKRISSGIFIEFLRRLILNHPKKIFLVVDGLATYKAKSVQKYLETVKNRLKLFFLPPYSPELNRDELVWNDVKNHGVGRKIIISTIDLDRAVQSGLRKPQRNSENAWSFFQTDTTRYAVVA